MQQIVRNRLGKQHLLYGLFLVLFFMGQGSVHLYGENSIEVRKQKFLASITNDPKKINNPNYDLTRVMLTVKCSDADDIPVDPHAGELVQYGENVCQIMHNGVKVLKNCYYGENSEWMTDIICGLRGLHEPQEEKVFNEVLKFVPQHGVMLELGSYWAYYSLWFAKSVKEARNYLIEPDSHKLLLGKKNFELNNCYGFFFQGFAGYNHDKTTSFRGAQYIRIDDFVQNENIDHIHILHSDIQGAEFSMLQTCVEAIKAGKIDFFFISTHGNKVHNQCRNFFLTHNFEIIAEHTRSESYSGDGLIVAQRKEVQGPGKVMISKYKTNT